MYNQYPRKDTLVAGEHIKLVYQTQARSKEINVDIFCEYRVK